MTKSTLTDGYRGFRDFYPHDKFFQSYLFDVMKITCESFGYQEYGAPTLEFTELYTSKTSEEIVNEQTYTFEDRGGRTVTMRPEMTPSVARMVAAKERELAFPLRWYSVENFFRYERPQRGRVREFWQLNADIFGVAGVEADIEVVMLATALMKNLGASEDMYVVKVNDRRLLDAAALVAGLTKTEIDEYRRLLDRKEKLSADEFASKEEDLLGGKESPLSIIENSDDPRMINAKMDFDRMMVDLEEYGVGNIQYDPSIVRGFDYYTGMVFEIFDTSDENPRALFGGGRYDELVEQYGGSAIPAVGFAPGELSLLNFLETHKLLPEYESATDVYICTTDTEKIQSAQKLGDKLRDEGLNIGVNITDKKLGDQIKYADKQGIPYILTIGEDELSSEQYPLKNLESGKEEKVSVDEIISTVLG